MCDLAFTLLVERLIVQVQAELQAVAVAAAFGAEVEWPTVDGRIAEFTEALAAPPVEVDPRERRLRSVLGLKGA